MGNVIGIASNSKVSLTLEIVSLKMPFPFAFRAGIAPLRGGVVFIRCSERLALQMKPGSRDPGGRSRFSSRARNQRVSQ